MSETAGGDFQQLGCSLVKKDFYRLMREFRDVLEEYPRDPDQYVRPFSVIINGKRRNIITYQSNEKGYRLRRIHKILAAMMRRYYHPSYRSYAYKRDSNVKAALEQHLCSDWFLKTDIHSYFDSIDYALLEARFLAVVCPTGYRKALWIRTLKTCFYQGHMPIGFISSPMLSDMYLHEIDVRYAGKRAVKYTRYADDLIISGSGKGTEDRLIRIRGQLEKDLGKLKLELNTKKTYIRQLKQEGDAIHLLGLNMVRREQGLNEITVSDRFIRDTSRELCQLVAQKPYIEDGEARKRFFAVMGRIEYIRNSSARSAEKLKKMLYVKAGIQCGLTYQELAKICTHNPDTIKKYMTDRLSEMESRLCPVHYIPRKGKAWIRFSSLPGSRFDHLKNPHLPKFKGVRDKVLEVCRDVLNPGKYSTDLKYMRLTINGETKLYTGKKEQAEEIQKFADGIMGCTAPVDLFIHYEYTRKHLSGFTENKNHLPSPFYCARGEAEIERTVIVADEDNKAWDFWKATSSGIRVSYAADLLDNRDGEVFSTHPLWLGDMVFETYWPLNTEKDTDSRIRAHMAKCREILKDSAEYTEGIRSFRTKADLCLSGETAAALAAEINDLTLLVSQAGGESVLSAWMIPEDFLAAADEKPFDYVKIIVTESGKVKIRSCTL